MPSLQDFTDFVKSTPPAWASSSEKFVNELQATNYPLRRFLKGRDMDTTFQGGSDIRDEIILDNAGTFSMVSPETETNWTNTQTGTIWKIPWRFAQVYMSWVAQEVDLNAAPEVWKRVKKLKQYGLANDVVNGLNGKLFQKPNKDTMESFTADPGEPYSVLCFASEQTNGLPNTLTTTADGGAWTKIQDIDPTVKTRWKRTAASYGASGTGFTANVADNVTATFDDIVQDLEYQLPGTMNEYFENTQMFRQVIWTTKTGIKRYKALQRAENDVVVQPNQQDPYWNTPAYAGIAMERAPDLETVTAYGTSGAGVVQESTTNNSIGPRYIFANMNYLKMAFHDKWYFKYLDVFSPEKNRTKYILPMQIWFNLYCTSLRHQGIVYPAADQT